MFASNERKKAFRAILLMTFALRQILPSSAASSSSAWQPQVASGAVETIRYEWTDAKRNREVPVKIYFPPSGAGPFPVIIFSHGLGGTREGYEFLGRYWAAHGYVSVHMQHLGSDAAVWQDEPVTNLAASLRKSAANLDNAANRPLDVSFAIDQLEKLNREASPLKNRLDLARIGVAGHSFGAFTVLAVAGEVFITPGGREISYADPRVKAAIAMSSPVPARKEMFDRAFGKIKIPVLHMTGTQDFSPIGNTRPEERRIPFDHINAAPQFLLTFKGADHSAFAGVSRRLAPAKENLFKELICESSLAFWDAYLKSELGAKVWLLDGSFKKELGTNGIFELKLMEPSSMIRDK